MNIPKKDIELHTFIEGMDSDTAPEGMPPTRARFMLNVRSYSFGQRGVITNIKGNIMVSMVLPAGDNKAHGWAADEESTKFYFAVHNSNGLHTIYMYDGLKNTVITVLQSKTDSNGIDILNFNVDFPINHWDIVQNNLSYFVDGYNKARKFNITKALDKSLTGYGVNILQEFVNAYKLEPIYPASVAYITDITRNSNFLYGKLFKFTYRFIYDDGEKSNWCDFSAVALPPNQSYSGINSITYDNNCIQVTIETGSQIVVKIEVAMKVGSLDFVTVAVLDKAVLSITDNSQYVYNFYNDGSTIATDQEKINRQYSFLPPAPACQSFVKNAMTYSKFYEGFETVNVIVDVSITYEDLYIPDGTEDQLNNPSFICTELQDNFTTYGGGTGFRHNIITRFEIGPDVKAGNKFQLFAKNGGSDNYYFEYTAIASDDATTIANKVKSWVRAMDRGIPDHANGITNEMLNPGGSYSFDYYLLGTWKQGKIVFTGYVNPVNYSSLKDDGLSINLIKPGSTRKYAISYQNDDTVKSLAYTSDKCVIRTAFPTELGSEGKRGVHQISLFHKPPIWARYYQLLRTPDSGPWIDMLIQKVIAVDPDPDSGGGSQQYLDLVVGSLFTYQKLHPNTVLVYDFQKGDRLRLINYYSEDLSSTTLYPYLETEVLSYSIDTEEIVNENVSFTGGSNLATIDGTANPDYVGKYLVANGYERLITGISGASIYELDRPLAVPDTPATKYSNFSIIDRRGILRIKKPVDIDVKDLSKVEIYKPQLNSNVDGYKEFFPFGAKYEIANYGTDARAHRGNVQDQYSIDGTTPAIIKVQSGDAYERNRELPTNNSVPGTQFVIGKVTDPNYSDFYESDLSSLGRVFPQDDGSGVKFFDSRIRFSNNYIQDTKINGLADFDNADREDYNDPYGAIMLTRFRENRLYVFKVLKTAWVPILQSIINDNSGQQIIGTSSKLLNQMQYYAWNGGISNNPESYVSYGNYQYFASVNSGVFIRVAGDGCDPISRLYNYDKRGREILSIVGKYGLKIYGGVDRENGEIIWSVPDYNNFIFNGGFLSPAWNTNNDAVPEGTTFAIITQPANSVVTISGTDDQGNPLFKIAAGSVVGPDSFTYRGTLSDGVTYLPLRNECFNVVPAATGQRVWESIDETAYCIVKNTIWEAIPTTKYCILTEWEVDEATAYCVQEDVP